MADKKNVINETNDESRALARSLIKGAQFASLAVLEPVSGVPVVNRIAVSTDNNGAPIFLASDLSGHCKALVTDPRCSIMFGEPPDKGDPLAFPRITVIGKAQKITKSDVQFSSLRQHWLEKYPKSKLYIDFTDFNFYLMDVERGLLNGGFGKAFELESDDLVTIA